MIDKMASVRVDVEIENPARPGERQTIEAVPVDTNIMLSCFPAALLDALGVGRERVRQFERQNGTTVERWCGAIFVYVNEICTIDDVVFGETGDVTRLGWRTLSGLNLRVDSASGRLSDGGPIPAAIAV